MYTRNKLLTVFNIINKTILIGSIIQIIFGVTDILSLTLHYWGDTYTIIHAKSTPQSVFNIISGIILTIVSLYFIRIISDARFYSGFFECDLDGTIQYEELANVTGKSISKIKKELSFVLRIFMKRYSLVSDNSQGHIELYGKKILCSCKHCGAEIEKKEYFSGKCPYCNGSDVFARVLTDKQFYSIVNDTATTNKPPVYYQGKNLSRKKTIALILAAIATILILIILMYACDTFSNLINYEEYIRDYYRGVLFEGKEMKNYGNINPKGMVSNIVFSIGFILCQSACLILWLYIFIYSELSQKMSFYLSECKKPFINLEEIKSYTKFKQPFKCSYALIRSGYLKNATFEKHNDEMMLALAKKVQKDICPHCGGPITDAVDDKYICKYCQQPIMGVVVKK